MGDSFEGEVAKLLKYLKTDRPKWQAAIEGADLFEKDGRDDTAARTALNALAALLDSETDLDRSSRQLLADLLRRHSLKRRPGQQQSPIYRKSEAEAVLLLAGREARALRMKHPRMTLEESAQRVHQFWELDLETLIDFMRGRRGASRRAGGRRPRTV